MRCPFCSAPDTRVVDSRLARDATVVRRRRACSTCGKRFTTYEQVEEQLPMVVKRDGRREPFYRTKALEALRRACVKRAIPDEQLQSMVESILSRAMKEGATEVSSSWIGDQAMELLLPVDRVAYLRFASVFKRVDSVQDFLDLASRLTGAQ